MPHAPFSVIIPAHNEEAVIARCLEHVYRGAPAETSMEVIVVANGCVDETANVARRAAPSATVIELTAGSKTRAMNAASERAQHFPRIFLDADVRCDFTSLAALAEALTTMDALAASPKVEMDVSRSNWFVRAYYNVWQDQPYAHMAMGGSGCFAIAKAGIERIGPFPEIIGDDFWAMSRFSDHERVMLCRNADGAQVRSLVTPPRTIREQVRVEARRRIGNEQVRSRFPSPQLDRSHGPGLVRSAFASKAPRIEIAVFLIAKVASKLVCEWRKIRGNSTIWVRDNSSRQV